MSRRSRIYYTIEQKSEMNERPRKTLEFATPAEIFKPCVALTG
jgi:IS30 family transposase